MTSLMGWQLEKQRSSGIQSSDKFPRSIYGAWHVSSFSWFLSRIEASLRLLCTFPIKTTPFSSHFSTFHRNTLSKHARHLCQRSVHSTPASLDLIRSLFSSISNFLRSLCFFFIFHSLWKKLYLAFVPHHPFQTRQSQVLSLRVGNV